MAQAVRQVQMEIKDASVEGNGFFASLNKISNWIKNTSLVKYFDNLSEKIKASNANFKEQQQLLSKTNRLAFFDDLQRQKEEVFAGRSEMNLNEWLPIADEKIKQQIDEYNKRIEGLTKTQKRYIQSTFSSNKATQLFYLALTKLNGIIPILGKGLLYVGSILKTAIGMIGFIALLSLLYDAFSSLVKVIKEFAMGAEWAKQMNIIKTTTESASVALQAYIDKLEYLQSIKAITEEQKFSKALLETANVASDLTNRLEKLMLAQDKLENVQMKRFFSSREEAEQFAGRQGILNPNITKQSGVLNSYVVDYEVDVRFNEEQAKQAFKNINKWLDENLIEGNGFFSGRNIKDSDFELNVNGLVATLIDDFKQLKGLSVDSKEFEESVISLYETLSGFDWQRLLKLDEYWKKDREKQKGLIDEIFNTIKQEQSLLLERNKWRIKNEEDLAKQLIDIEKRIRGWNTNAIDNDYQRTVQAALDARQNELDSLNKLLDDEKITRETYNRAIAALERSHTEDLVRISRDRANKIYQLEQDTLKRLTGINPNENSRTLNELKNTYDNELKVLKDTRREGYITEKAYQDNRLAITQEYNYKVGQENRRFFEEQQEAMKEFNRQREEFNRTFNMDENAYQIEQLNLSQSGYQNTDIDSKFFDRVSKGYEDLVKNVTEYQMALMNLQIVQEELNADTLKGNEINAYETNLQNLDSLLERGVITQKQYNSRSEILWIDLQNKIGQINKQTYQNIDKITVEGYNNISQSTADGMSKVIASLGGLSDFQETFNMKKFINENKKAKDSLVELFSSNKITKAEFDKLWEEIEISEKDFWANFSDYVMNIASQMLNMVNDIIGSIGDIIDANFQNRINDINKEIELLEEVYSKQEELAQKHQDRINQIEDSLSAARGDRRDQLISQLAAEKENYIKSYKLQQEAEAKKLALQKQADALERQRNIKQQEIQRLQAIASGALTIVNAFATKPFMPVGLAMGALATGLVGAQLAAISAVKYEKGGLLDGPSHRNGGMPILGSNIEVEGGEYIVNKKASKQYYSLLEAINNGGKSVRKFADGGTLPSPINNKVGNNTNLSVSLPNVQVSVVDINNAMANVENVKVLAGY
jgi:hypothetical protein